jgi:hypothetical protein
MAEVRKTVSTTNIGQQWVDAWNASTPDAFVNLYAEDGEYYDATFGVRRRGHDLIALHHRHWRLAIPNFAMTLTSAYVGEGFVVIEAVGRGTFSGSDLAGGLMKATMEPFTGRTAAILSLNPAHKIKYCHEYYDRAVMPGGADTPYGQV